MKKLLIALLVIALLAVGIYCFREPILAILPIDRSGWEQIDGSYYLLDEKGNPRTGWAELDYGTYYLDENGVMHTGWLDEGENRYYFDGAGVMVQGWKTLQGKAYYFGADGALHRGFLEEEGKRFYLDENGNPASGFFASDDTTYFVLDSGTILSGWLQFSDGTYYLNENGTIQTGWVEDNGNRYYFGESDGSMSTGWVETPEGNFYLNSNGTLSSGLVEMNGTIYGFDTNGEPLTGWAELDGKRYYFADDGSFHTGWLEDDGKRYYILEDGTPAVGKLEIDGQAYFFSSTGMNFIMVNPWHSLPEGYEVNPVQGCGTWLDPVCQEALEQMLADCRAAGLRPQMVSGYRSIADQRYSLDRMIKRYTDQGYGYDAAYAAATQIVAVPGTSEHHLGLAFDIVDSRYPHLNYQQATMETQQWLMEHCWEYGFILRYPENTTDITGIIWEPWHYRYVGVELALEIRDLGGIPLEVYIDSLTGDGSTCGGKYVTIEEYNANSQ